LIASKDEQIDYLQSRIQYLETQSDENIELAEAATNTLKARRGR
jgi:hypothetical protein